MGEKEWSFARGHSSCELLYSDGDLFTGLPHVPCGYQPDDLYPSLRGSGLLVSCFLPQAVATSLRKSFFQGTNIQSPVLLL